MHIIRKKWAYYNENDPKAAAWIRELIKAGLVTDGEVDERSIDDVLPSDVIGFVRCHWFAGIAVWDYALNQAGYDRWDTVTWTGSCPCQPFSVAGNGLGVDDERHLWPAWERLIRACRPEVIFGEQVSNSDVTGRASGNYDYLRSLWHREELRRISHTWLAQEISRDVSGLSERSRAQTQTEQRHAHSGAAQGMAASESRLCPCVIREMSCERQESALRLGCDGDSATDRYWPLRDDRHPVRPGWGLEQSLFGQDRPERWLHNVQCPNCHHSTERDDEQMGSGQGFGDCICVEDYLTSEEEQRAFDAIFAGEITEESESAWLDLVQSDLERIGYSIGSLDLPAAGFGAPHIRQRLFFVADSGFAASQRNTRSVFGTQAKGSGKRLINGNLPERFADGGAVGELGNAALNGNGTLVGQSRQGGRQQEQAGRSSVSGGGGDANGQGLQERIRNGRIQREAMGSSEGQAVISRGATSGFWRDAEWIYCQDGKYRAVKPGTFPLAHGVAARMAKLRGIGNAIVAPVAEEFIRAYMEAA